VPASSSTKWGKTIQQIKSLMQRRIVFADADQWMNRLHRQFIHYLFTKTGQIILAILAIVGFGSFVANTHNILWFFSVKHESLWLLLGLIPLSVLEIFLHELGHAFAMKAYKRHVHFIGVGWRWITPLVFIDTSDIWLAPRKSRMVVNFAGVYVDALLAAIAALLIWVIPNLYVQGLLWLFALYTYLGAFRRLSPMRQMDGYYVLMDWVEKKRLYHAAVVWLLKIFPHDIFHPRSFLSHWPEITYWLVCLVFLILLTLLTFTLQGFAYAVLGYPTDPRLSYILPSLVVLYACFRIIVDIYREQKEV
jgi:hypothetical protein